MASTPYDTDFYAWSQHQAALLREGACHELDLINLAEEIESMGISQRHALESRLTGLLLHLLKWRYQPQRRQSGRSWYRSITGHRARVAQLCRDSPSLRPLVPGGITAAYPRARRIASHETGLPLATFPEACPWTAEQVIDDDFWPEHGTP